MKAARMMLMCGLLLALTSGLRAASTDTLYCNVAGSSCLTFDGTNDFVSLGTHSSIRLSGDLTLMAWVKMDASTSGRLMGITGKLIYPQGYGLLRNSTNKFSFWLGNGSVVRVLESTRTYDDSQWHHVAGVLRNGVAYLYVDGSLESSLGTGLTTVDSGQTGTIGRLYGNYSGYTFKGSIDEVRFYDRGLLSQDVVVAMALIPSSSDTGLKGYWNLNNGQGQIATDLSLYGNHGTLGTSTSVDSSDPAWTDNSSLCNVKRTYYVNATTGSNSNNGLAPTTAFATIQRGITACNNGDTVIVADGLYAGSGNVSLDYGGKAITVKSQNGAETTIIDCQKTTQGFYFHSGETETSVLDGFTIFNGKATYGGGIYCLGSAPMIRNCMISDCTATYGGGFYARQSGTVQVLKCSIVNNSATNGGGVYLNNCGAQLVNCVVADNTVTGTGGGLRCEGNNAQPTLTHCTVANNSAGTYGGGMLINYNRVTVKNGIFWGNIASQGGAEMTVENSGRATVNYTDVAGGTTKILTRTSGQLTWGTGNLNTDPLMPFSTDGDYHLASERGRYWPEYEVWLTDSQDSPCIDVGDPADDASGESETGGRPYGGRVNMGAYGATPFASRTLETGSIFTDRDHDGVIDIDDLFLLIEEWLDLYGG